MICGTYVEDMRGGVFFEFCNSIIFGMAKGFVGKCFGVIP